MTTTYTNGVVHYTVNLGGTSSGSFDVAFRPGSVDMTEADLDTAIQAFADSLNQTFPIGSVTKWYEANGNSDWAYSPPQAAPAPDPTS